MRRQEAAVATAGEKKAKTPMSLIYRSRLRGSQQAVFIIAQRNKHSL